MATYYWVGGSGTWNGASTTNWSASSGGAGGAGVPNSADTVIFDDNSGTGTATTASGAVCASLTMNSTNLVLKLGANLTAGTSTTLTKGTINLDTFTYTTPDFSSNNSNIRSIQFGTGKINVTGNGGTIWNFATLTNFSYTGTPTVELSYAGGVGSRILNHGFLGGGSESTALSFNVTAGTDTISANPPLSIRNFDFTGFSGTLNNLTISLYGNLKISSGMTVGAGSSVMTFAATSGTQQVTSSGKTLDFPITINAPGATVQLQDNCTFGATRLITHTAGALDLNGKTMTAYAFSSNNSNTRSIAFGTGQINITGSGVTAWNYATLTGFTLSGTPNVNFTYSGSTGTRTANHGLLGGATEANVINVNVTAGTDIFRLNTLGYVKNLNFTGFSGSFTNSDVFVYGNYTASATMTLPAGAGILTFAGTSGTQQITSNGKTLDFPITFNGVGGTFAMQDALTQGSTRAFTITNGTVLLKNSATTTVGAFATSGTNQKFLRSTVAGSQATLSQASGTVSASYLTIQDINATGGATWQAFTTDNNVDAGNNLGWDFSAQLGRYIYTRRKNKRILP